MANPTDKKPSYGPRCPNHGVFLDGLPVPMPSKGTGVCPISGCSFDYVVDLDEEKLTQDKFGNITASVGWKVDGEEK